MATVFITFFLFARFYVCKMDADCKDKRRVCNLSSKRVNRFSMDTQRFEDVLAGIKAALANVRNSFENVKISDILEDVLTEWARAALEADAAVSFTEMAVLLQHCGELYGRKVDHLHARALDMADALGGAAPDALGGAAPDALGGAALDAPRARAAARRRRPSAAAAFGHIALQECSAARRAPEPPRPPPTLPRLYLELEPRVLGPHDRPLRDYAGEPVGLPADFHVAGRLLDGLLVEELAAARAAPHELRPLSLVELQAAISAAAPGSPPPPPCTPPGSPARGDEPLGASTPLRAATPPPPPEPPEAPEAPQPLVALRRRRRPGSPLLADVLDSSLEAFGPDERLPAARCWFSPAGGWVSRVVASRARRVLAARRALAPPCTEFRGFEDWHPEAGGFPGWSAAEGGAARAAAEGAAAAASGPLRALELESDDDGFFERSSFSSFESSRTDYFVLPEPPAQMETAGSEEEAAAAAAAEEMAAWGSRVAARAAAQEARGSPDMRALGAAVLRALPPAGGVPLPALLARLAADPRDVPCLLLATLFLANSGNVEIVPGAPLSVGSFSVMLLSADERLMQIDPEAAGPGDPAGAAQGADPGDPAGPAQGAGPGDPA